RLSMGEVLTAQRPVERNLGVLERLIDLLAPALVHQTAIRRSVDQVGFARAGNIVCVACEDAEVGAGRGSRASEHRISHSTGGHFVCEVGPREFRARGIPRGKLAVRLAEGRETDLVRLAVRGVWKRLSSPR